MRTDRQSAIADRIDEQRRPRNDRGAAASFFTDHFDRRTHARSFWRSGSISGGHRPVARPGGVWQLRSWLRSSGPTARSFPVVAAAIDFIIIAMATFEAGALYHHLVFNHLPWPLFYLVANVCLVALFVVQCGFARDYSLKRLLDPKEQLRSVFLRWNSSYSLFVFALFMIQATDFYSRGSVIIQYGVGLTAAIVVRLLMARLVAGGLRAGTIRGRKVVIIGQPAMTSAFARRLRNEGLGTKVIDVFTLDGPFSLHGGHVSMRDPIEAAREVDEALRRITSIARDVEIDDIVIALPWFESERIHTLVEGLSTVPATIHLMPDQTWNWLRSPVLSRVGTAHTLRLSRAPLTLRDQFIKRMFDIAAASALLVLVAPLMATIALLIKLDSPGPVFFRQRRHGFNQREFRVFKFRTMTTLDDGDVVRQAVRNDQRITRIGRILRRTNLDEVPQLFNVILGDMSLVGPRPHAVAHNNEYEEQIRLYARRHNVKPGITGWAQVNGLRGETDVIEKMVRRVEHDLFYIDNWSVFLDIKIMLMTVFSSKSYRNAY